MALLNIIITKKGEYYQMPVFVNESSNYISSKFKKGKANPNQFRVRITPLSRHKKKKNFLRLRFLKSYLNELRGISKEKIEKCPIKTTPEEGTDSSIIDINSGQEIEKISTSVQKKNDINNDNKYSPSELLEKIVSINPNINIIEKYDTYLLRMKINKKNYSQKYHSLSEAREARNKLLLLSMENDPKYYVHLMRRNSISIRNKTRHQKNN